MKIHLILSFTLVSIFFLFTFQNCAPIHFYDEGGPSSAIPPVELTASSKACQFVQKESLSTALRNILNIESGDVAMLNEEGEPLTSSNCQSFTQEDNGSPCFYLDQYTEDLESRTCGIATFRVVSQVYINGCEESITKGQGEVLFPQGSGNFETIYQVFTGRKIRPDEVAILKELTDQFESDQEKMTAVCAAVGSSLAAINSF